MKRLLVIGAFVVLGVLGSGGTALAHADQASDRACVAAWVTGWVADLPPGGSGEPGGFGALVRDWAHFLQPFGHTVSYSATTCDFPTR